MWMPAIPRALHWLQSDTVFMVPVHDGLDKTTSIALVVIAVLLALLLVAAVSAAFQFRRIANSAADTTTRLQAGMEPVLAKARSASENIDFITGVVRTDVAKIGDSVEKLADRLHQASDRMEERIEEFNALMEVVQEEAEGVFLDTAATVRGISAGARALQMDDPPDEPAQMEAAGPEAEPDAETEANPPELEHESTVNSDAP